MYPSDREAGEMICAIGRRMYEKRFVSANDGNITLRVGERTLIATPTGVSKGDLRPEMLIKLDFDGKILSGDWPPTSEIEMHLNIYRQDGAIQSTCHAHPLYLTALACMGRELDAPTTPAAACIVGRVPVAPYRCSGTRALADSVIPYVKQYHLVNLANHGPVAWGKTPLEAWYRLEAAESACQLALLLNSLGGLRPLTQAQVEELVRFHRVEMTRAGMVTAAQETANQQPGAPFAALGDSVAAR